jgi:hypothetical protein
LSSWKFESEDVRVVDDALEGFVPRRQEPRVVAKRLCDELTETLEERQKFFDVFLRILSDDVGRLNLIGNYYFFVKKRIWDCFV